MSQTKTYICEICGQIAKKKAIPRSGYSDSEIPRCLICNILLCPRCFQHGFCPSHWAQIPTNLHDPLIKMHRDVEMRKRKGIVVLLLWIPVFLFIAYLSYVWNRFGTAGGILALLTCAIFVAYYVFGDFPYENLRKREQKYLAPYLSSLAKNNNASTQETLEVPFPGVIRRLCPSCGAQAHDKGIFCKDCGTKLPE